MTAVRLIGRRAAEAVPVLFFVSVLAFLLVRVVPGNPVIAVLGPGSNISRSAVREMERQMGLGQPWPVQYGIWLSQVLRGDLGTSIQTKQPVSEALLQRLPVTGELAALALLIAILIAVPLGVLAATHHNSALDLLASAVSVCGLAMPGFWIAILLIWLFAVDLQWLPAGGYVSPLADPLGNLKDLILPAFSLGLAVAGTVMRQVRSGLLEQLAEDYARTARAKGASRRRVVWRHSMRNALLPVVTVLGLSVSALMGGSLIIETIFLIPGVGSYLVNAIFTRDFPVVQGGALVVALIVILVNLMVDVLYGALDPRVTSG